MDDELYGRYRTDGNRLDPNAFQDHGIPFSNTVSGALKKMMLHGKGADKHALAARGQPTEWAMMSIHFPTEETWLAMIAANQVEEVPGGWTQREGGFRVKTEIRVDPGVPGNVDVESYALRGLGTEEWAENSLPYFGWKVWPEAYATWHCNRCRVAGRSLYECPINPGHSYCSDCSVTVFQNLRGTFPQNER